MEEVEAALDQSQRQRPLCVDLDGTLVSTDLLYEGAFLLLRADPKAFFSASCRLLAGRASFKDALASLVEVDPVILPYNSEVLEFLREEKSKGRTIVLATASERRFAERVAEHVGLFDEVIATENGINLKGEAKAQKLRERFGSKGFDYIGDSAADIPIWKQAEDAYCVGNSLRGRHSFVGEFPKSEDLTVIPQALRVHQWVKNLLLFVPLIMAHQVADLERSFQAIIAFFAFSLCSSGVYLLNDLFDLSADRTHPRKCLRPFASGKLLPQTGIRLSLLCFLSSLGLSLLLPFQFLLVLGIYFVVTSLYSLRLKSVVVLDIVVLALLYTIRIVAGGASAEVVVSQWLLAFSMFLFLSLACVKRLSELLLLKGAGEVEAKGRGYRLEDIEPVATLGGSSGYMSVLVMALYVTSADVSELYRHPELLWLICPILLYWISRVWLLAHRGDVHDDPIVFALRDRTSYFVGGLCLAIILLAI